VDYDKLILSQEFLVETKGKPVVDLQTEYANSVFLMYENTGDNETGLLNVGAIKMMIQMEDII
jgi:hypothetical protein